MSILADQLVPSVSVPVPVPAAVDGESGQPGLEELRDLMRAVNDAALRLEGTQVVLQTEVDRLKRELADAHAKLRRTRALAELGQMAAGIAHEIRNPLGSIRLYVQMLGEEISDDPSRAQLCDKIARGVMSLDAIVRDVLQFARDMKIRPVATSPRLVIDEVLDQCEQLIVSAGIEVEVGVESEPTLEPPLDTCLMTRAIGNIVRNAVEAMAEAGARPRRLRLSYGRRAVRCPDGRHAPRVVIAVEDTGPGIPPEVVSRMFNPFFTTRTTGTGLGLAIVHRIVDAHGGHINVRNRERGGACVELCLPERHDDAARPAPAEEEVPIEVVLPRGASPTIHVQSH